MPDIWTLLDQDPPDGCGAVQDLFSWSLNYDAGKGPFTLFCDLIGWTVDNDGHNTLFDFTSTLGYLELDKLAKALTEYADRPQAVREYVDTLMSADS